MSGSYDPNTVDRFRRVKKTPVITVMPVAPAPIIGRLRAALRHAWWFARWCLVGFLVTGAVVLLAGCSPCREPEFVPEKAHPAILFAPWWKTKGPGWVGTDETYPAHMSRTINFSKLAPTAHSLRVSAVVDRIRRSMP